MYISSKKKYFSIESLGLIAEKPFEGQINVNSNCISSPTYSLSKYILRNYYVLVLVQSSGIQKR